MIKMNGPDPADPLSEATETEVIPGRSESEDDGLNAVVTEDPLIEIDEIVDHWSHLRQESVDEEARVEVARQHFLAEFQDITESVIRPTMEMAIERLREDGGGGLIEEYGLDALHKPRVILWMSMENEIEGSPRQDLNPFVRFDADLIRRRVDIWEGDMVARQGTSRAASALAMSDITSESVMDRIVEVLRRAGNHGVG